MDIPGIAIVGYGERVKKTVIPALLQLKQHISIQTIITRKPINPNELNKLGNIKNTNMDNLNKEIFEFIYLGVPSNYVLSTLSKIVKKSSFKGTRLILDTPFPITKKFYLLKKILKEFKEIYTLEDCLFLKPYSLAFSASKAYQLGNAKFVNFIHSGFRYHAYSQIKFFLRIKSFDFILRTSTKSAYNEQIIFKNFKHIASIHEPRDYNIGKFSFWFEKGTLSNYINDSFGLNHLSLDVLPYFKNKKLYGFELYNDKRKVSSYYLKEKYLIDDKNSNLSIFNNCKIDAVSDYFMKIVSDESYIPYTCLNSAYDSLVAIMIDKFGFFIDIPIPFLNSSLIRLLIKLTLI